MQSEISRQSLANRWSGRAAICTGRCVSSFRSPETAAALVVANPLALSRRTPANGLPHPLSSRESAHELLAARNKMRRCSCSRRISDLRMEYRKPLAAKLLCTAALCRRRPPPQLPSVAAGKKHTHAAGRISSSSRSTFEDS
eukprot:scaffold2645_cov378-Prasinococcus_capsulatus_cf.AAC.5